MQSYGFILKQPKFSLLFCSNKKSLPQEAFPTAGIFLCIIVNHRKEGLTNIIHILFYKDTPIPLFPTSSTG